MSNILYMLSNSIHILPYEVGAVFVCTSVQLPCLKEIRQSNWTEVQSIEVFFKYGENC